MILCTEGLFLRTQNIYSSLTYQTGKNVGGERIRTANPAIHSMVLAGFHISQLVFHAIYRVSDQQGFSYNYFVTGEDEYS